TSVPNHSDCPRNRPGGYPGENSRPGFRSITYPDSLAPGVSFVGGIPNEDIVIVRVTSIDCAVRGNFDDKEEMGITAPSNIMGSVSYRGQTRRRGTTYRDTAIASTDVNRAIGLIDCDPSGLTNCTGGCGGT